MVVREGWDLLHSTAEIMSNTIVLMAKISEVHVFATQDNFLYGPASFDSVYHTSYSIVADLYQGHV